MLSEKHKIERRSRRISLNVIIPMYNEKDVIPLLIDRLSSIFSEKQCESHNISSVEYLFVDDGSTDKSAHILFDMISASNMKARIVRLSRNFGHQPAVSAGISFSEKADVTAVIDADLQDPPEMILEMITKWRQGYDVVYGQRKNRKENPLRVILHWLFYRLYKLLSAVEVPLDSGDFCLMSNTVVKEINKLPEKLKFLRGLRSWVGFRQTGIVYDRPARSAGKSKYGFRELYDLATNGIASTSTRPLQITQGFSFAYFVLSTIILAVLIVKTLSGRESPNIGLFLIIITILFSNAFIFLCLYVLSAYIGRTYLEVKSRPNFIISQVIDINDGK